MEQKGYVQVYTGNGKGKTTASLGLALRAVGAGKKIYIAQFVKGMHYSELESIHRFLPQITLKQYGRSCFIFNKPTQEDVDRAKEGLAEVEKVLLSDEYDLIILDEANIAVHYKLFSVQELIEVINKRNPRAEVVVTGRYATDEIMEYADLVTEMREIKHYFQQGVKARKGIEK